MTVRLYAGSPLSDSPPLCCGRTALEVRKEEGRYASRCYHWFFESSKSSLTPLGAVPGLIDTLAQLLAWRSLIWLFMTWRRGYLTQNNFLSTTSLAWSLALDFFFFFHSGEAFTVEVNTHTHTTRTRARPVALSRTLHLSSLWLKESNFEQEKIKWC